MLSITAFEPFSNKVNGTLIDHSGVELKLAGWYTEHRYTGSHTQRLGVCKHMNKTGFSSDRFQIDSQKDNEHEINEDPVWSGSCCCY